MPPRPQLPRLVQALFTGMGVVLVVGTLQLTGLLTRWELNTRDYRTKWTLKAERGPSDPYVRPDLFMISVTDNSLELMDQQKDGQKWPWDRETQANFIKACTVGKAAAILYDFILTESGKDPEDDNVLVKAIQEAPPTFFAGAFLETQVSRAQPRPDQEALLEKFAIQVDADDSISVPERYHDVKLPISVLCKVLSGVCDISTPRDQDGLIRRYRLFSTYRGRMYPSFALAALMAREKASKVQVRNRRMTVGSLTFPIEPDASILLRYYPPGTWFPWKSAYNVVTGVNDLESRKASKFDFRQLEGKTVIVGTNAAGLTDLRVTPVTEVMPGPEIHLTALGNLLNGDYLREAPRGVSIFLYFLLAVGTALTARYTSALWGAAAAVAILGVSVGGTTALYQARWIVDLVPQLLGVVLAFAAASAVNFLYEGRQRLQIKRTFSQYVSPKVVEKILKQPDALHLEGERKPLTIFFMDFAGFTAMSEKLDPSDLVKLISEYHHEAAEEIFRTEGTLDKFIGDAIMAFWNDPIDQTDHPLRACLSAIAAQKRLTEMARVMRERGLPEMSARIGINTGIATVGNMGARGQVNYTLIGDEVNLASRLEGVNKEFGTKVIVSESTYLPAKEKLEVRELSLIKVKGKKQPVRIFELIGLKGEASPERLEAARKFEAALAEFRARRFSKAWEMFLSLSQKGDHAADVYVGVCERYMSEPPPEDWDRSYQMDHK